MTASIAILGEYDPNYENHVATDEAIKHSAAQLGAEVHFKWISTADLVEGLLEPFAGIWVSPGSPYKDMDKTLDAIRFARENDVPFFGTCGGFQHLVIEYARNVLGIKDADHAEYDHPDDSKLVVGRLDCSLVGREMQLTLTPDSRLASIYGSTEAVERYYCNFGVNPEYVEVLQSGPLRVVASDSEGEIRAFELPGHRFFAATLYVPQALSTPEKPHPVITEFVRAVASYSN